ncbi:MAG: hypothetical protein ABIJ72_03820 [bacterium]
MLNFSLFSLILISSGLLFVILFNTNPIGSSNLIVATFFISLLTLIFALTSLVYILIKRTKSKTLNKTLVIRRSLFFSLVIVGLISFSALNVLNFISAITFIIAVVLLEFFFSSKKVEQNKK